MEQIMNQDMRVEADKGLQGGRRLCFPTLPSTQFYALDHMDTLRHGDVIWARRQTHGRGRFDRVWQGAGERSLAFSIVLKEASSAPMTPRVLQIAALAVCSALRAHGIAVGLKWPNDVVTQRGKIAGILAESVPAAHAMVLGIGVNVNMTLRDFEGLSPEKPATSMRMESGESVSVSWVLDQILSAFERERIQAAADPSALPTRWARYDILAGNPVVVHTADGLALHGTYKGMNPEGALILEEASGKTHTFWSGEVSLSRPPPASARL